ncbi:unnamed protein product [Hymenolepis diminuta]|uniref:Histone-lysine N-methyltransferase ash1 n=1 Tax=Hymenolepis diminuta TaxID=6216 RepID=A0A0R3SCX3_HYMDI|nr:unnamed protein product [Hymenolepis diminuta]
MSKPEKKGKRKKTKEPPLQITCPLVKDYAVGQPPTTTEIEAIVLEAEREKQPFTGTAAKGKVSLKSSVKGKKPPKINFKKVQEARQLNNDNKMVALKSETKKGGQLIILNCKAEEEAKKFLQMTKIKNQKVKIVNATNRSSVFEEKTVNQPLTDTKEPVTTVITAPGPAEPTVQVTVATAGKNTEPLADSPIIMTLPPPESRKLDSATSGFIYTFETRATSPQYNFMSVPMATVNTVDKVYAAPPITQNRMDTDSSLPPKRTRSNSSIERRRPISVSDHSSDKGKLRSRKRLVSSSSSSSDRGRGRTKNHRKRRNSSSFSSSSSSSSSDRKKRSSRKSRNRDRRSRRSYSSSTSSYSDLRGRVSTRYSNKQYADHNMDLIVPKTDLNVETAVPTRIPLRRSSSVDFSNFSLMRISNSTRSITNLYSFGVPVPYSNKTSFSHRIHTESSESSMLDGDETGSDFSYVDSDISDGSLRARSKHSSYRGNRYKAEKAQSLKVM